jgi:hypothetical protein
MARFPVLKILDGDEYDQAMSPDDGRFVPYGNHDTPSSMLVDDWFIDAIPAEPQKRKPASVSYVSEPLQT